MKEKELKNLSNQICLIVNKKFNTNDEIINNLNVIFSCYDFKIKNNEVQKNLIKLDCGSETEIFKLIIYTSKINEKIKVFKLINNFGYKRMNFAEKVHKC